VSYQLIHGDCLAVMAGMDAASIDAVVCDPPYGLEFMGKEWDRLTGKADVRQPGDANYQTPDNPHGRSKVRYGYGTSMAPMQAWHQDWAEQALTVLKPSHYLLAFGGTRTWHRLACAIEDAGFEIRDTLMWLYGSGFPKGKACLKPAWEPIILARKPGPMRELGIEECRIATDDDLNGGAFTPRARGTGWEGSGGMHKAGAHAAGEYVQPAGRWPANVILDEAAAGLVDEQTGERRSAGDYPSDSDTTGMFGVTQGHLYADSGGASRFYYCAKASRAERNAGCGDSDGIPDAHNLSSNACARCGMQVQSNGSGRKCECGDDRVTVKLPRQPNHHPTVKPLSLMQWLVRLVARPGDVVLDPFTGSGTTGVACIEEGREFVGIERELDYVEISRRRLEAASAQLAIPLPTQDSPSVLRANDTCDTGSQDSLWRETASSDRG
jgi:site-specific DNA-methyltransferase (adenine-specific)